LQPENETFDMRAKDKKLNRKLIGQNFEILELFFVLATLFYKIDFF